MRIPQLMKEYRQLVELLGTAHLSVKKHLARSGLGGSFARKASWDQGFVAVPSGPQRPAATTTPQENVQRRHDPAEHQVGRYDLRRQWAT